MPTQTPLLILQKTMVVVEGVARRLYPETNIWEVSRPVLENWLKDIKSPKTTLDTAINTSAEIIKRIPDFPNLMDKANQALTYFASGQIPQSSNSYLALSEKKSEMITIRNRTLIGLLLLSLIHI